MTTQIYVELNIKITDEFSLHFMLLRNCVFPHKTRLSDNLLGERPLYHNGYNV